MFLKRPHNFLCLLIELAWVSNADTTARKRFHCFQTWPVALVNKITQNYCFATPSEFEPQRCRQLKKRCLCASPRMTSCVVTFRQHAATSPVVVRPTVHERYGLLPPPGQVIGGIGQMTSSKRSPPFRASRKSHKNASGVNVRSLSSTRPCCRPVSKSKKSADLLPPVRGPRLQEACVISAPGTHSRQQLSK